MQMINQDILKIDRGIITQQCNCKGVMGAGLARAIRDLYPTVYTRYRRAYEHGELKLGTIQITSVGPDLVVGNLMAQEYYGRDGNYTDYMAMRACFRELEKCRTDLRYAHYQDEVPNMDPTWPIYLPYGIGCGLAGGNWQVVSEIIDEELPHATICKKP